MKVRIEIDTKTFVRFWLVVIGFAFVILALYSARTALTIIGVAFFLALALNGPVSRLAKVLPDRSRTLSTAIAFTVVVAILAAVVFLVVPPIVQQTAKFIDSAPGLLRSMSEQWQGLGSLIEKYHIQPQVDQAVKSLQADSTRWAAGFGKNFISGIGSAMSMFAAALLVLVLTFLMLVEGPGWLQRIWGIYRDERKMKYHKHLVNRMHSVVSGYVTGQLTVTGIGAACAGAMVFILSLFFPEVPANLALPTIAITFTLALIPMFGATIAGVIVSLLLVLNSLPAGIIFAVYFMIYQQVENNFISPTIQARRIELSPLAVLVAVTVGLYVFGIAGGIISIPVAGCLKVLVEEYFENNHKERVEQDKPLTKLVKKLTGEEA
ncbi:MAG TPA: AI-2E family transporter [Candidatus Saccharimonas sp.]|jgi:predicted PurR-regulated permease PerM|nr:AI-2E family transporter [Candidatus Saccharimonas sp.]